MFQSILPRPRIHPLDDIGDDAHSLDESQAEAYTDNSRIAGPEPAASKVRYHCTYLDFLVWLLKSCQANSEQISQMARLLVKLTVQ